MLERKLLKQAVVENADVAAHNEQSIINVPQLGCCRISNIEHEMQIFASIEGR